MGDMKTPDFDDLLAAFDIPDIDAKEAIQSTPDEPEGGHRQGADPHSEPPGVSVIVKNTVRQEGFGEAGSDTEKPDGRPPPSGGGVAAVTLAIEPSLAMRNGFGVPSPVSSPSSSPSSSSSSSPSSSPSSNSFSVSSIAADSSLASKPLALQDPQTVSNGDLWSPLSPKTPRETATNSSSSIRGSIASLSAGNSGDPSDRCKVTNIFSRLRPLVAQSPVDLIGKVRERKQQQQQVPLQQHRKIQGDGGGDALEDEEEEEEEEDDEMEIAESAASSTSGVSVSVPPVSDASPGVGVPFFVPPKPAPAPLSPAAATISTPTSMLSLEPQNNNPPGIAARLLGSPPPLPPDPPSSSCSVLFERNSGRPTGGKYSPGSTGFCSEESEPDIGSPLVIQESPESPSSSPPRTPRENAREPSPAAPQKHPEAPPCPPPLTLPQPSPQSWPQPHCPDTTGNLVSSRKKSPEHIVEERDSPQSPEPEIQTPLNNKTPVSNSVASAGSSGGSDSIAGNNNNTNPATSLPLLSSSPGAKKEGGEGEPKSSSSQTTAESRSIRDSPESPSEEGEEEEDEDEEEEEEEEEGGGEEGEVTGAAEEGRGSAKAGKGKNNNGKGGNKSASSSSTSSSSSGPSRPLKVRIKTVKTSTGGITRTVTRVAPRSAAPAGIPRPPTAAMETEAAGGAGGSREGAGSRKPTPTAVAPKRKLVSLQLGDGARLKGAILPASTIQNASGAMLIAASKAQGRIAALAGAAKPEKSKPPAKAAMGRPALSPANQKAPSGAAVASKPASIVNSGGAVISRSQTSLVEAFNKILNSKNLLPSYQPDLSPPAEWSLELPQCGYRCLECGDAFSLERSLARHYDRRSMRIEVTCNHCARRLVFFNKCSLLLHAREHKDTGLVMQCSHLVMRPVSVEQMIGQQPDATPAGLAKSLRNAPPGVSNGAQGSPGEAGPGKKKETPPQPKLQPPGAPLQPQPAMPLSCRKEELLQYRSFKCPECKKQFKGKTELAAHFQEVISGSDSSCTQCAPVMMMSNPCSGSAHRRMHRHQAPHVCPECGGVARPAGFQTHLKEACLHFSRRIGYKCSSCQVVFGGLNSIKSHIQSVHCEVFHKCPTCPMAFKSTPGAHAHISTQHPSLENQQAKMIYKCVMCDTVFTHKALLHTHFDMHLAKQKVHVFKCPDCTKLYAQKHSMMEHIKSAHRNGGTKPEPPPPAPAQRPSPQKAVRSAGPVKLEPRPSSSSEDEGEEEEEEEEEGGGGSSPDPPSSLRDREEQEEEEGGDRVPEWRCFECRARFSERDEYITHMRKDHGKSVKKFPCRLCDRSFCSAPSLRRHVRVNHEGIKRVFHCEYCTEGKRTFSSRLILEKHVRVRHGIRTWGPSSEPEGPARKRRAPLERDSSSDMEGGAAAAGGGGARRRRRMRAGTPTKIRKRKAPQPQPQAEPAGPFSCQKCGFTTESRPEFQAHIPQHHSDESSHQCTHCGLCFASQPSLNRHCFITHRVKQPSPPGDPSEGEGEEGQGQQGGLSCQVCGKLCETAVDLRTHFRTHGMAFIRARKTGGAEK